KKRAAQKGGPFHFNSKSICKGTRPQRRGLGPCLLVLCSHCAAFKNRGALPHIPQAFGKNAGMYSKIFPLALFYFWGTRRSRHSRYFSWVLATTSAGSWGAGVTPSSLFSMSQSRRYC